MSVQPQKITVYTSPQVTVDDRRDVNQNITSLSSCNGEPCSKPQRKTIRMRINNPKDLELLQSAAASGNAMFAGKKVRIVSIQPSQQTSHQQPNTGSNDVGTAIQSSVLSPCATASDVAHSTSRLNIQYSVSSLNSDVLQLTGFSVSSTSNQLVAKNSTSSSAVFTSSMQSVGSLHTKTALPLHRQISQNHSSDVQPAALLLSSAQNLSENSSKTSSLLSTVGCSSSGKLCTTGSGLGVSTFSSIGSSSTLACLPATPTLSLSGSQVHHLGNSVVSSPGCADTPSLSVTSGNGLPVTSTTSSICSQICSTGVAPSSNGKSRYVGTFSVKLPNNCTGVRKITETRPRRIVLRITSKNNSVDVKSLLSKDQWPSLLKGVEKVLSENKSSSFRIPINMNSEVSKAPLSEHRHNVITPSVKEPQLRTVYGTIKKKPTFNGNVANAKTAVENYSNGLVHRPLPQVSKKKQINKTKVPKRPNCDGCRSISVLCDSVLPFRNTKCARVRPFVSRKKRKTFSFLLSQHRKRNSRTKKVNNNQSSTMTMSERFQNLHAFVNDTVYVYRSPIHGLGLYAVRTILESEMIIEYAGEVIRASVADVRERRYQRLGIGCYMFRHGDDDVVDATVAGNAARFINHSCSPNCYSREVVVDGRPRILIFSKRRIARNEELTYDYKFPVEDVKMPCTCQAPNCRKYLN